MISSTELIRYLEKKLGYKFMNIEISHEEILENIRSETLITFSKYFPNQERTRINTKEDLVDGYNNRYYLKTENEIININRLIASTVLGNNVINDMLHPAAQSMLYGDPITRQMEVDMLSTVNNPTTFAFYPPNKIEIYPVVNVPDSYIIVCNVVHSKNFYTIPINLQDQFFRLALYDTQDLLYHIRNRFSNLQTTFGNIELYLDEYRDANDKRIELLEDFKKNSLKFSRRKKIFIA